MGRVSLPRSRSDEERANARSGGRGRVLSGDGSPRWLKVRMALPNHDASATAYKRLRSTRLRATGSGAAGDLIAVVGGGVAAVGGSVSAGLVVVALVGGALAFVGEPVAFILGGLAQVGKAFAVVGGAFSLVGQAFPLAGVWCGPGRGLSPSLVGAFAFVGGFGPFDGRNGAGCSGPLTLGVGQPAKFASGRASLDGPSSIPGDLLSDRSRLFGLIGHVSAVTSREVV
jgi:hypothetical protein